MPKFECTDFSVKQYFCIPLLIAIVAFITSCSGAPELDQRAQTLAQETIIVDGHVDLPFRLRNDREDISRQTEDGDFDYVRAKEGGLNAPFMSIYIPARYQETGGAKAVADSLIDMVVGLTEKDPDKFAIATSPEEIQQQFDQGVISLPMGMENGAPIGKDLENIRYFYNRGIRYITLTHSKDNLISDSSYDTTGTHDGLSPYGEKVVREMNRVGMMVDISHISDNAFYDVMAITEAPVIASHSSCRYFTPGFERNMSDEMIKALADNGGVIMINFGSTFIDEHSRQSDLEINNHIERWLDENRTDPMSPEGEAYINSYRQEHFQYSTVQKVADHIDHVVKLVGINHVGLGSDFDGVGDTLPKGLKDVSDYPTLIEELLDRGYSKVDVQKICSGNIFRVWNEVEAYAQELQS